MEAIKRFQADFGLEPDAVIRPGGPTERALSMALRARDRQGPAAMEALRDTFAQRSRAGLTFRPHPRDRNAGQWVDTTGRTLTDAQADAFAARPGQQLAALLTHGLNPADNNAPQSGARKPPQEGRPRPKKPDRSECAAIMEEISALTQKLLTLRREEERPLRERIRRREDELDALRKGGEAGGASPVDRAPKPAKRRVPKSPKGIARTIFEFLALHAGAVLEVYNSDTRMRISEISRELGDLRKQLGEILAREFTLKEQIRRLARAYDACLARAEESSATN